MRLDLRFDLSAHKTSMIAKVDREAGEIRKLFITEIPGQELVYDQKRREAELIALDPDTPTALVPHIAGEALAIGETLIDTAAVILTLAEQWKVISAEIERRRIAHKAAIAAATTRQAVTLAAEVDWAPIKVLA